MVQEVMRKIMSYVNRDLIKKSSMRLGEPYRVDTVLRINKINILKMTGRTENNNA